MIRMTRRGVLGIGAGLAVGATAGCLDGSALSDDENGTTDVQTSFYVIDDFTRSVAGDAASVENLVPTGQHGHGWEPGPDVQRSVVGSDVFVYVGEGFQPWADRIVTNLEADGEDVAVVEARAGVDLLDAGDEHEGEDDHDDEHEDDEHDEYDEQDEAHDHGEIDPHFWLDPRRAEQSVETIAAGLEDADPEHGSTYRENAGAYADRLADLDAAFEEGLAGRTKDVVLFAGHDSFRYLEERYGFEVEALTGLAPDAEPSPRDVRHAQAIVEEHDVEYVLAPVIESDQAARQLVEDTDATEVLPLTPIPGVTEEWREDDWGYVEIMENVNLPTLQAALGAQ